MIIYDDDFSDQQVEATMSMIGSWSRIGQQDIPLLNLPARLTTYVIVFGRSGRLTRGMVSIPYHPLNLGKKSGRSRPWLRLMSLHPCSGSRHGEFRPRKLSRSIISEKAIFELGGCWPAGVYKYPYKCVDPLPSPPNRDSVRDFWFAGLFLLLLTGIPSRFMRPWRDQGYSSLHMT